MSIPVHQLAQIYKFQALEHSETWTNEWNSAVNFHWKEITVVKLNLTLLLLWPFDKFELATNWPKGVVLLATWWNDKTGDIDVDAEWKAKGFYPIVRPYRINFLSQRSSTLVKLNAKMHFIYIIFSKDFFSPKRIHIWKKFLKCCSTV